LLARELDLDVTRFLSGPLGGDQQVGAGIVEQRIDFVIFFWDPLEPQPHDVDVKALLRIAVVYNVPIACNRSTADFLLSSPLMRARYERIVRTHQAHRPASIEALLSPTRRRTPLRTHVRPAPGGRRGNAGRPERDIRPRKRSPSDPTTGCRPVKTVSRMRTTSGRQPRKIPVTDESGAAR
jgi:MGS-like domain